MKSWSRLQAALTSTSPIGTTIPFSHERVARFIKIRHLPQAANLIAAVRRAYSTQKGTNPKTP